MEDPIIGFFQHIQPLFLILLYLIQAFFQYILDIGDRKYIGPQHDDVQLPSPRKIVDYQEIIP